MKKLIIIGASGHGKVVADIAKKCGYEEILFLDNNPDIKDCAGYKVCDPDTLIAELDGDVFIAIGNNEIRKQLMERYTNRYFPVLLHPNAVIAEDVEIGRGSVVMAGAVINPGAKIGQGCIVNTCSSIDHDCIIGDYVHISVGAHIAGTVYVGTMTWIGIGATVSNNLSICDKCVIGAGAVVIKNISVSGTYIGIPAQKGKAENE